MVKKILLIVLIIIVTVGVGFEIYFLRIINQKGEGEKKSIIIEQGQSTKEIAQNLKKENLITSAFVFEYYAKLRAELIQVGIYWLSPSQSIKEILEILAAGDVSEYQVTIPEGWRLTQIDEQLAEKGIISAGQLVSIASAEEGYLFPDTYRFLPDSKPEAVLKIFKDNFAKRTAGLNLSRENLILASIVEREAKFDEDRAKIAGVYLNRLEKGMKLEADPTIQYAKGSWDPIKQSDYKTNSSTYNTYLYEGLPPGPICNPGLKSIEAVLSPEKNGFLFFFHTSDGRAVYSTTAEEHAENLKKYQ